MTSIPNRSTVVVIGGGPAGAYAAAILAKNKIEVVLLEKETFPRYQVGESVIPHVWKFLDLIDLSEKVKQANFIKKSGGAVLWDGVLKAVYFSAHGYKRPGLHVEREVFDNLILDRCKELGAQVYENVCVTKVDIDEKVSQVCYTDVNNEAQTISADYVIDASGQSAIVSKQEGIRTWDKDFKFQAVWGYYDKSKYLNGEGEIMPFENRYEINPMSLASSTGNWGWVWHLIMKDKVSVGAIIPMSDLQKFKSSGETLDQRFLKHINATPLTNTLLSESRLVSKIRSIRDYAYEPQNLVVGNCFLVGDAASFADPINSEGVTMSIFSGFLAAESISKCLRRNERAAFYKTYYEQTLRRRYQVFKVLSYPSRTIPKNLIKGITAVIANQSKEESLMILDHLYCTNRAFDYPELLRQAGIDSEHMAKELAMPI